MTASLQDRFVVGSPVESHEQMDAMPVGTVLEDGGSFWVKGDDDQWYDSESDGTFEGGEGVDSSVYVMQGSFRIHSVSNTGLIDEFRVGMTLGSRAELRALPNGSVVGSRGGDFWVKDQEMMRQSSGSGEQEPGGYSLRVDNFSIDGYVIHLVPEAAATPTPMLVTVPWQALTEGMYVRPIVVDGTTRPIEHLSVLIAGSDSGDHEVWCAEDDGTEIAWRRRYLNGYETYQVLPQDGTYRALKAFGEAEAERLRLAGTVVSGEDVEARVRREVNAEWAVKMERLNTSAHEYANDNDLCSVFDDFMDEHSDLGFTPRKEAKDFEVEVEVTGVIRKTVTVEVTKGQDPDTDDIYSEALSSIGLSDGDEHSLHYENFRVTNVSAQDYEEV